MNNEIKKFLNKHLPNEKNWKYVIIYNTIFEWLEWLNRKDKKKDVIDG